MRIQFVSDERAKRISKSIKNALADLGHDLPYSRVREATAAMFGYRNWNDLLAQAGKSVPSPYDHEVSVEEAALRRSAYVERLASVLGISPEVAAATVDGVGPTSRKGRLAAPVWTWAAALDRMARHLSRHMVFVEPAGVGQCEGFLIQLGRDAFRGQFVQAVRDQFVLAVAADGSEVVFGRDHDSILRTDGRGLHNEVFGSMLQKAGLLAGESAVEVTPHPLVLATLSRLDGDALSLLRTVPAFTPCAYEIAYDIPEDAAFRNLVRELPMLGSEIQSVARTREADTRGSRNRSNAREIMIGSDDPLDRYLTIVMDAPSRVWPGLVPPDRASAERALRAVGRFEVAEGSGLLPLDVALLSHAPESCLPKTPEQMAACMLFSQRDSVLFESAVGLRPADFFRELEQEFGGNWNVLRGRHHSSKLRFVPAGPIGDTVAQKLALELGFHHGEFFHFRITKAIYTRLLPVIAEGRGCIALEEILDRWYSRCPEREGEPVEVRVVGRFDDMSSTGLLPERLRNRSARELLELIGLDLADILDPEDGLIVDKSLFHSVMIGGIEFKGVLSLDGPHLSTGHHGVALGDVAEIRDLGGTAGEVQWWVCKYGSDEPRIPLPGFDEDDVDALAGTFGIEVVKAGHRHGREFTASPAWEALKDWVRRRPQFAEEHSRYDYYIPKWYDRAVEENGRSVRVRGG